jgi:prepilin-type N-terminal cleavage/methylation domain-containing protein
MKRRAGFTLIELLVVIAIIAVLAAIAVPAISGYLLNAQKASTVAEIAQIDIALAAILSDTGRSDFRGILTPEAIALGSGMALEAAANQYYADVFYSMLRQGRNIPALDPGDPGGAIRNDIRLKLRESYLELGRDSWDQRYNFFVGPIPRTDGSGNAIPVPFRSYRLQFDNPEDEDGLRNPLVYDRDARDIIEEIEVPGQPRPDGGYGIPARRSKSVFVWSNGVNTVSDQGYRNSGNDEELGGGDDINNWDAKGRGWEVWY